MLTMVSRTRGTTKSPVDVEQSNVSDHDCRCVSTTTEKQQNNNRKMYKRCARPTEPPNAVRACIPARLHGAVLTIHAHYTRHLPYSRRMRASNPFLVGHKQVGGVVAVSIKRPRPPPCVSLLGWLVGWLVGINGSNIGPWDVVVPGLGEGGVVDKSNGAVALVGVSGTMGVVVLLLLLLVAMVVAMVGGGVGNVSDKTSFCTNMVLNVCSMSMTWPWVFLALSALLARWMLPLVLKAPTTSITKAFCGMNSLVLTRINGAEEAEEEVVVEEEDEEEDEDEEDDEEEVNSCPSCCSC